MAKGKGISRVIVDVGLGAFGLLLGAFVFVLFQSATGGASGGAPEPELVFEIPAVGPGAETPEDAVRLFLDAEAADDAVEAFRLLSEADRVANVSARMWASREPLGGITEWQWVSAEPLVTAIALEPGLSLTRGWSPASTTSTWTVVEQDGWRVSLAGTISDPVLPNRSAVAVAAGDWLSDSSRCSESEDPRLVLATPSATFDQLCSNGGVLADDTSSLVSGRVAAELERSYGSGANAWARSVPLEGGVELILAAVGDQWVVIDANNTISRQQ